MCEDVATFPLNYDAIGDAADTDDVWGTLCALGADCGYAPGETLALRGEVTLGRHSDCTHVLRGSQHISGQHCRLVRGAPGGPPAMLTDLSANGTFVNDVRVGRHATTPLRDGDVVCVLRRGGRACSFRFNAARPRSHPPHRSPRQPQQPQQQTQQPPQQSPQQPAAATVAAARPQEAVPRPAVKGCGSCGGVVAGATEGASGGAAGAGGACRTQTVVQTALPQRAESAATGLQRKYDVGEMLGRGNFATVYAGLERESGRSVAVKVISKSRIKMLAPGRELMVYDEVRILRRLDHPHIIKVLDVFDTDAELSVVLELFVHHHHRSHHHCSHTVTRNWRRDHAHRAKGGDLLEYILSRGRLPGDVARPLFLQIVDALTYLHDNNVVHRDLKPENLLLDTPKHENVKITDFGLSKALPDGNFTGTLCGTPAYIGLSPAHPPPRTLLLLCTLLTTQCAHCTRH